MIPRYAEATTTDGVLTGQQVRAFRRDGYVVVPGLFSAAEIEQVSAWGLTDQVDFVGEAGAELGRNPGTAHDVFRRNRRTPSTSDTESH